ILSIGAPRRSDPGGAGLTRGELVEAAGIEPASRNTRASGFYVRVPRFGSRPPDARGRASFGPVSVLSRRSAPRRDSPASPLVASPPSRGRSRRRRLPDVSGCEREIVGMQCRPERIYGVTRDPRHATWRQVKPVETGAPPFRRGRSLAHGMSAPHAPTHLTTTGIELERRIVPEASRHSP